MDKDIPRILLVEADEGLLSSILESFGYAVTGVNDGLGARLGGFVVVKKFHDPSNLISSISRFLES